MKSRLKNNFTPNGFSIIVLNVLFLFLGMRHAASQNDNISGRDIDDNPKMHLGVKAGISMSTLESKELTNKIFRPRMAVGIYGNYLISKKVVLQVEMNGIMKGSNFNYTQASSLNRLSLFYFEVPVLLHFQYNKKAKILPFAGVQPSLIFRKDAYKSQEPVPQPIEMDIKNYDFAISGGILYKMDPRVGLQLQFNYGIININNVLSVPFYPYLGSGSEMFNRNLQLCLVF